MVNAIIHLCYYSQDKWFDLHIALYFEPYVHVFFEAYRKVLQCMSSRWNQRVTLSVFQLPSRTNVNQNCHDEPQRFEFIEFEICFTIWKSIISRAIYAILPGPSINRRVVSNLFCRQGCYRVLKIIRSDMTKFMANMLIPYLWFKRYMLFGTFMVQNTSLSDFEWVKSFW